MSIGNRGLQRLQARVKVVSVSPLLRQAHGGRVTMGRESGMQANARAEQSTIHEYARSVKSAWRPSVTVLGAAGEVQGFGFGFACGGVEVRRRY